MRMNVIPYSVRFQVEKKKKKRETKLQFGVLSHIMPKGIISYKDKSIETNILLILSILKLFFLE